MFKLLYEIEGITTSSRETIVNETNQETTIGKSNTILPNKIKKNKSEVGIPEN